MLVICLFDCISPKCILPVYLGDPFFDSLINFSLLIKKEKKKRFGFNFLSRLSHMIKVNILVFVKFL